MSFDEKNVREKNHESPNYLGRKLLDGRCSHTKSYVENTPQINVFIW